MKFYIIANSKREGFYKLKLEKSSLFSKSKKDSNVSGYEIRDIDNFTMQFEDKEQLRASLVLENVLPYTLSNNQLFIFSVNKKHYDILSFDFLYKKDKKFFDNPDEIIKYIMTRYYKGDFEFIRNFANNYIKESKYSGIASDVSLCATMSINQGICCNDFAEVDKNGDNLLKRLIKLLLFEHYQFPDGYVTYKNKINYYYLHSVIDFINKYDGVYKRGLEDTDKRENAVKTKKRVKVENSSSSQISFDDILKK